MKDKILTLIIWLLTGVTIFTIGILVPVVLSSFEVSIPTQLPSLRTPKAFVILSGSMEPSIKVGSIVITIPTGNYSQGDIVTFVPDGNNNNPITHRIEVRKYPNGINNEPVYITSGDANKTFDPGEIKNENIKGKVITSIPYLGYIANFAKTPKGFILLVIIPATIVVYEEFKSIWNQIRKQIKKTIYRFKGRTFKGSRTIKNDKSERKEIPKASVIIPIFGAFMVLTAFSGSFFSDSETSTGNVFTAFTSTPSPTPTPPPVAQVLVIHEVLPVSNCPVGNDTAQWIEVYNGYSITVNLKNFKITDGSNTVALVNAGNIDVPPGGFALLSHDNSTWNNCYDDNGVITANLGTGNLNLNTGLLELLDSSDQIIDHVQWGSQPDATPPLNQSVERVPIGLDSATGNGWNPNDFIVREMPTPGYGSNLVLNEILSDPDTTFSKEWVEIYNPSSLPIDLTGWTLDEPTQLPKDLTPLGNINPTSFKVYENPTTGWLNNTGEVLQLLDPSDRIIDQHTFGSLANDQSEGRITDRNTNWINPCLSPSQGSTNNGICQP